MYECRYCVATFAEGKVRREHEKSCRHAITTEKACEHSNAFRVLASDPRMAFHAHRAYANSTVTHRLPDGSVVVSYKGTVLRVTTSAGYSWDVTTSMGRECVAAAQRAIGNARLSGGEARSKPKRAAKVAPKRLEDSWAQSGATSDADAWQATVAAAKAQVFA